MKQWASFPGHYKNEIPPLSDLEDLFLNYSPEKWTDDGSVQFIDENGIRKQLTVVQHPRYGIWLQLETKNPDGKIENYFSCGNTAKLNNYVEAVEDSLTPEGIYISPEQAWPLVKHFIETAGGRATNHEHAASWIREEDLPEGMYWLVSADCL